MRLLESYAGIVINDLVGIIEEFILILEQRGQRILTGEIMQSDSCFFKKDHFNCHCSFLADHGGLG